MRYTKPEVLTITKATAAIQGGKAGVNIDGLATTTPAAYEDNE
jgi:hypothetical protein